LRRPCWRWRPRSAQDARDALRGPCCRGGLGGFGHDRAAPLPVGLRCVRDTVWGPVCAASPQWYPLMGKTGKPDVARGDLCLNIEWAYVPAPVPKATKVLQHGHDGWQCPPPPHPPPSTLLVCLWLRAVYGFWTRDSPQLVLARGRGWGREPKLCACACTHALSAALPPPRHPPWV
jgi:hypothetical protein